ncbi:unnamed protein product [Phytophthora fragariaefolia]|uniref:Unnamed protein product n=1 Tax=Phytophthora fragariaefolia TaxID=1490495 RepID=A0A9W6TN47_9STRA|nr:unnamed protein product [Phytophthora fragariaefolia]
MSITKTHSSELYEIHAPAIIKAARIQVHVCLPLKGRRWSRGCQSLELSICLYSKLDGLEKCTGLFPHTKKVMYQNSKSPIFETQLRFPINRDDMDLGAAWQQVALFQEAGIATSGHLYAAEQENALVHDFLAKIPVAMLFACLQDASDRGSEKQVAAVFPAMGILVAIPRFSNCDCHDESR